MKFRSFCFQPLFQLFLGLTFLYYGQKLLPSSAAEIEQDFGFLATSSLQNHFDHFTYPKFLLKMFSFDFGESITSKKMVLDLILEHLPYTLWLACASILFSLALAIPLSAHLAQQKNKTFLSRYFLPFLASTPTLVCGPFLLWFLGLKIFHFPISYDGSISSCILPVLSISLGLIGSLTLLAKTAFEKAFAQNFIRTAHAKGASPRRVVFKHAFANTIVPVFSFLIQKLAYLLSGSFVVETIFGWPGLGQLLSKSIFSRDFPVLEAVVFFILGISVLLNLIRQFLMERYSHEL